MAKRLNLGVPFDAHYATCATCRVGAFCPDGRRLSQMVDQFRPAADTPILDALQQLGGSKNSAGLGVTGSQAEGITAAGYVSKDLGKGGQVDAQAGLSSKSGWGVSAWWRKVWK